MSPHVVTDVTVWGVVVTSEIRVKRFCGALRSPNIVYYYIAPMGWESERWRSVYKVHGVDLKFG